MVIDARTRLEDNASFFSCQHGRLRTHLTLSTNPSSRSDQECGGARSRARTESSIARRHSRRCGCREHGTEDSTSGRITCDRESSASALADTVGDRACLDVNEHDGDHDEEGGSVEEAHGCSGCMRQSNTRLVAVTGKTHVWCLCTWWSFPVLFCGSLELVALLDSKAVWWFARA